MKFFSPGEGGERGVPHRGSAPPFTAPRDPPPPRPSPPPAMGFVSAPFPMPPPGTPQIQTLPPAEARGTAPRAGAVVGIIAGIFLLGVVSIWLTLNRFVKLKMKLFPAPGFL